MKGKLRNKIFLLMALVSIAPVVVAGVSSVYGINLSHRVDVARLEESLINKAAAEIDASLSAALENGTNINLDTGVVVEAKLGERGYLYLVDLEGRLIAGGGPFKGVADGTDLNSINIVSALLEKGKSSEAGWKISVALEGEESAVTAGRDFLGAEGQQRYKNFFGEGVVAAGRFLPKYGWGLVAEWPEAEADASVNELIYNSTLISVSVFAAAALASILLAILIVRPIKALERGTEKVAQGKFDEEVKIKTGDELEELGEAFNKMTAGLRRLEELKEEFIFVAAHELRTPVVAIKGYLALVLDGTTGEVGEKTREFIQKVIRSNDRLIQLVDDLLEVSRSEAGRLKIEVSSIDIVEPIRQVLAELEKMAEEKGIEVRHKILPNMPKAFADPDRVKEVMINLLGNAIKYIGLQVGGVNKPRKVMVSHELAGNALITHVRDTGLGMSDEAQKGLFEKFYRIPREEVRGITGTGLGLFIVKEIIEKMGGKVWAYSEGEGKGSTFSFSLPLARAG